ncbi:hypothetical protein EVAR_91451_1 [Eumeta japonica]|uniref:Uncharacterized protein n=1 Tax=Eumeta variegata TaxID=151549 RepID=A0A4C1X364_EUMVA|nr:hypothetical protein EVAR_91451_1 [Eumeta japonica]
MIREIKKAPDYRTEGTNLVKSWSRSGYELSPVQRGVGGVAGAGRPRRRGHHPDDPSLRGISVLSLSYYGGPNYRERARRGPPRAQQLIVSSHYIDSYHRIPFARNEN